MKWWQIADDRCYITFWLQAGLIYFSFLLQLPLAGTVIGKGFKKIYGTQ